MTERPPYCNNKHAASCDSDVLSAWNARLIDVITDCEDDKRRYRNIIDKINGVRECNASVLEYCMEDTHAHRHLILFTALHIVESRFQQAGNLADVDNDGLSKNNPNNNNSDTNTNGLINAAEKLQRHIGLITLMMRAMFSQMELVLKQKPTSWNYGSSILASLIEERLRISIDDAVLLLHKKFSCTLATVLMAAIEPAMKSVQDRLSLRPELPLDIKTFAGAMLGLKCKCSHGASVDLVDLASDISQIFRIPRTICRSD
jgi:hypothetical protein